MQYSSQIKLISSGVYLPKSVSSEELESRYSCFSKGFSEKFSGVKTRHQATFETNGFMGARAIEQALEKANLTLKDIDLLISAAATFDYPLPSQSSVIKSQLKDGEKQHFSTFDVNSTCLSFVSALEITGKMLDGNQYKNIIIVSSEIASKGLDSNNPETLSLFGDGAVAFVISYDPEGEAGIIKSKVSTYSEGVFHTIIKGGGNVLHVKDTLYDEKLFSFQMKGMKMLKLAKREMPDFMKDFLKDSGLTLNSFDVIVPHQASKTGIQLFKKLFDIKDNQIVENIETHGNCIAASIPFLLHETIEKNLLKRGQTCLLFGTSAGFSIGALAFKY
jgi:3-oxoacyl-[acyl-carrier-protein] synthase-3